MSCSFLYIIFFVGFLGDKVKSSCDVLSQCNIIVVQATTNHISVSGMTSGFVLQNITNIIGTAVVASDGSYNNTSLMTFVSGTPYTIHYGNASYSCCYNITTKPMPVTSPQITDNSYNSVSLSWIKPVEFQASYSYLVKIFLTSPSVLINTTIVNNEAATIMNLAPGETFTFVIYTRAADNATESDPVSITTCTVPGQAVNITANNYKSVNSLVVNWTAPTGKVSGYNVTVTGDTNKTKLTTSTQVTFTGLSPGREYTIIVETVSGNCSQISPPVTEATFPTPPGNISLITTGTNNTLLSWGDPVNMTSVMKSYIITYWNSSSSVNWTQTSNRSNVTLQSLASGTNYTINVVTFGVHHYPSVPVARWVYTKPFPVKNLQALMTSNTVYVHWTKPEEYKNTYHYKVRMKTISSSLSNTTVTMESLMLMSLSPGETYTFLVYTIAGDGVTESDPVTVTNCTVPGQAVGVTADSHKSVNSLVVNWTAPEGKVSSYNVTITGDVNKTIQTTATQVNVTGLSPGRNYAITVQTVSGNCSSPNSAVTEATYPSQPGNITFNVIGTNIIGLSWGEPVNMSGVIKSYNITYRNSTSSVNWTVTSNAPNVILPSLTSGTNYTISVVTVGLRQHLSVPLTRWVYTKPLPVKLPQAVNVTSSTVLLTWTRPDGYISFHSYRVQTIVASQYAEIKNTIVLSQSATIVNLTAGETYTFLIYTRAADNVTESDPMSLTTCTVPGQVFFSVNNKSMNSLGLTWIAPAGKVTSYNVSLTGAISKKIQTHFTQVTFLELLPGREYTITVHTVSGNCSQSSYPMTDATYPTAPGSLTFNKIGTNSIKLSWGEPLNMTGVTKSYQIFCNSSWTLTSNKSVTLEGLKSGTNYTIAVMTVGVRGYLSEAVNKSVYTSPLKQPGSVQVVRSSSGDAMDITFQGFDTSNGPIVAYAIIMTTDLNANKPPDGILTKTYNDFKSGLTNTYVTSLIENIKTAARSNEIRAHVGDRTSKHRYVNGPLDPNLQYRISVAGFTIVIYDPTTDTINEDRSTTTITNYTGSPSTTTTTYTTASPSGSTKINSTSVTVKRSSSIDTHRTSYIFSRFVLVTILQCVCYFLICL